MVTAARFLGCLALSLAVAACSQGAGTTGTPAADAPSQARGVVIATVVTHDAKVAILGGGKDLRVIVRKLDGTLMADGLTLAELRVQHPAVYEVVTSASASVDGTYVDATLGDMN